MNCRLCHRSGNGSENTCNTYNTYEITDDQSALHKPEFWTQIKDAPPFFYNDGAGSEYLCSDCFIKRTNPSFGGKKYLLWNDAIAKRLVWILFFHKKGCHSCKRRLWVHLLLDRVIFNANCRLPVICCEPDIGSNLNVDLDALSEMMRCLKKIRAPSTFTIAVRRIAADGRRRSVCLECLIGEMSNPPKHHQVIFGSGHVISMSEKTLEIKFGPKALWSVCQCLTTANDGIVSKMRRRPGVKVVGSTIQNRNSISTNRASRSPRLSICHKAIPTRRVRSSSQIRGCRNNSSYWHRDGDWDWDQCLIRCATDSMERCS